MTSINKSATVADNAIRYTVGKCTLGSILVAMSDKGIRAISLGDDPEKLTCELRDGCSDAVIVADDADLGPILAQVINFVDNPATGIDIPLDIEGTAFQRRVWRALQAIPSGETASYQDIAGAIGDPKAHRAVANACGANPVALAVPCHRVLRKDGQLGGYRWGPERKRLLLERERRD